METFPHGGAAPVQNFSALILGGKHDADGARAGVAANGGANVRLVDLLKFAVFFQAGFHGLHAAGLGLAGGDEHHAGVDVVPAVQLVGDVHVRR